mgnify:CR=1 FL=1|jgi:hypothetical protein
MKMKFEAPLPGANFTADTKNYSWHRPPDITNYDEAINYYIQKMDEDRELELISSMLQIDIHISTVVAGLLMQGISKGKIPIDLAILIAGPLARYIEIVAKSMDIKYDMGVDDKDRIKVTPTLLRASLGMIEDGDDEVDTVDEIEPTEENTGGLMSAPEEGQMIASSEEQSDMLGGEEETEMPVEGEEVAVVSEELENELA